MIVPIYISELAPPAIRGRLVGLYELGWQVSAYPSETEVRAETGRCPA